MSYRPLLAAFLLLVTLTACGKKTADKAPDVSETQEAQQLAELFGNQCVNNIGHLAKVNDWAVAEKLPEITDANARKVYVGDAGGDAWVKKTGSDVFIIALREGMAECAVFGAHADPAAFADYFDQVVQLMAKPLGGADVIKTPEPDKAEDSPYGQHVGKIRTIALKNSENITVTMLTFQKPGGAYQASMQVALTAVTP